LLLAIVCVAWLPAESFAARAMIYQVTLAGYPDSFVVGTMHSEDPRVKATLVEIRPLLDRVDRVVLELVPDGVAMLAAGAATLLPEGRRLRQQVDPTLFDAVAGAAAQRGIAVDIIDRMQPWAVALLLGLPEADTGRFLDQEIYLAALAAGRPVTGLESVGEQLMVFRSMPSQLQLQLLDETVKNVHRLPTQLEQLTQLYLSGDARSLERITHEHFDSMPRPLASWFEERLLHKRNRRMLGRLQPLLADEAVMVAVGAMHLGGDSGLLAGLRRLGFEVSRWTD
jgi:uncharacterized protein YbaP (TraB family)